MTRRFHFSLTALFVAMLVVAAFFGRVRYGRERRRREVEVAAGAIQAAKAAKPAPGRVAKRRQTTTLCRFILGWIGAILLSMLYPAFYIGQSWVTGSLGDEWRDLSRWLQNSTTFCFHQLCAMPVAVGLFAATFQWNVLNAAKRRTKLFKPIAFALLAVMLLVTGWIAFDDYLFGTKGIPPFQIVSAEERKEAFAKDRELRFPNENQSDKGRALLADATADQISVQDVTLGPFSVERIGIQGVKLARIPLADLKSLLPSPGGKANDTKAADEYRRLTIPDGVLQRGIPGLVFNLIFASFAVVYFWHVIVLVAAWHWLLIDERPSIDNLIFIMAIFILWLPARVYASWYAEHLVNSDWLISYGAFWLLAMLAVGAMILLGALKTPNRLTVLFGGIVSVLAGILAAMGHLQPDILNGLARAFEHMKLVYFFALLVASTASLSALAVNLLEAPKPKATESQAH